MKISRWLCPKFVLPIKFKIKNYCLPKSVRKMKFSTKLPINFTLSQEALLYAKIRSNYLASNETRQNIFSMNIIAKWIGWADIRAPKLTKITFCSIWVILFCFIFWKHFCCCMDLIFMKDFIIAVFIKENLSFAILKNHFERLSTKPCENLLISGK